MCCPLYIIRCDAPNFVISKSQKKVLKRLKEYLLTGSVRKKGVGLDTTEGAGPSMPKKGTSELKGVVDGREGCCKKVPKKGAGPDPSKPPCRKAKEIRKERKMKKVATSGADKEMEPSTSCEKDVQDKGQEVSLGQTTPHNERKPLEDYLDFPTLDQNPVHKLQIRLVRSYPQSDEFRDTLKDSYEVYKKYQINVHKDPPSKASMDGYKRFLVDSPLSPEPGPPGWHIGYGSYHQQYYLDGRLIMVGVVDIFPNCLSSKYLYYDTDYDFLTLGVVSALNEMALTRRLHSSNPAFRYYCMGYYNHTCQKMRYKGQYTPSSLLCTETNTYVPIEKCRPKLDHVKHTKLADDTEPTDTEKSPVDSYLDSTLVLFQRQPMPYEFYKAITGRDSPSVREYASLVGPDVAKRTLLFVQ